MQIDVYRIGQIKDLEKFIADNLSVNNDVMLNIWLQPIFKKSKWGHYVLVSEIDTEKAIVKVCDPGRHGRRASVKARITQGYWKIGIDKVKEAMRKKWDGSERGVIVIRRITK